jgi:hypothetical protein
VEAPPTAGELVVLLRAGDFSRVLCFLNIACA